LPTWPFRLTVRCDFMTRIIENTVIDKARACTLCADFLTPRPVFVVKPQAKLLIVGQAPGKKVHETQIPWNDPSGDRLRQWLNISRDTFYHSPDIAILPAGFCYPGRGKSGDLPPPPICFETWHHQLKALMPNIELTLLIGMYAQKHYLKQQPDKPKTLTETVKNFAHYLPQGLLPLPHPSPRNTLWLKRNEWFEAKVVPALQQQLKAIDCVDR